MEDREFLFLTSADIDRCGVGMGEQCCCYLLVGRDGPECAKVGKFQRMLQDRAETRRMGAIRVPTEDYPNCQLPQ